MTDAAKRKKSITPLLLMILGLPLLLVLFGVVLLLLFGTVTGGATLPSGGKLVINADATGYGVSENKSETIVTAKSHDYAFKLKPDDKGTIEVAVDGNKAAEFDASTETVHLKIDRVGVTLEVDEKTIPLNL